MTEIIKAWSNELSTDNQLTPEEALIAELDDAWLTNQTLAKEAVNVIKNAVTQNNNWDIIEDFKTKWDMLKFIMNTKMKKKTWVQVNILNSHFQPPENINK